LLGRKTDLADALGLIMPGVLLVVALRAALVGADWRWIALPLALSLPFHLFDLGRRVRSRRPD
jgi:hypothetical protein